MVLIHGMVAGRRGMSWGLDGNVVRPGGLLEPRVRETLQKIVDRPRPNDGEEGLFGVMGLQAMGLVEFRETATGGGRWHATKAGEWVMELATPGTVLLAIGPRDVEDLRDLLRFGGWGQLSENLVRVHEQLEKMR